MLKQSILGKTLLMALTAGAALWTTGCFHDHDDRDHRGEHAGWHERGGYDGGGYDRGHDYDHDYR